MAYEKMNVVSVLNNIASGKMYLPAIQRKYVWTERQIIRLRDSIMRGYPIGTFLFWKVGKEVVNEKNYSMYQFIKDYHERDRFNNPPAPKPLLTFGPGETIHAVLDGQQRLTSLYIALQGTFSSKIPKKWWSNNDAYPPKELYIDLRYLGEDTDSEFTYRFAFLTEQEVTAASLTDRASGSIRDQGYDVLFSTTGCPTCTCNLRTKLLIIAKSAKYLVLTQKK